jgi:sodium/potassium-transporting ATPase subunit alpha
MSVANMWVFGGKYSNKEFADIIRDTSEKSALIRSLLDVAILNSRVALEKKSEDADFVPNGDATELGLYRYFGEQIKTLSGKGIEEYREANPKVHEVPFNSSNKWQMSVHRLASLGGNKEVLLLKGAPDVLLSKCSHYLTDDGSINEINADFSKLYTQVYEDFGGQGERVLGFAMKVLERTIDEEEEINPNFKEELKAGLVGKKVTPTKDLTFVGLITLMDPPRDEVPQVSCSLG